MKSEIKRRIWHHAKYFKYNMQCNMQIQDLSWTAISDIISAISKIGIFNSIPIILSGLNLYPNPDGCIKVRSRVAQVAYDSLATNGVAQVGYYIVATNRETESFLIVNSRSQSVGGSGQAGTGAGAGGMS
jgi:hypothetical protein